MQGISPETRVIFWIIAQIAGGVFAILGSVLAINFIYFIARTGRPPTQRSPLIWGIFLISFAISIVFGALANFATTSSISAGSGSAVATVSMAPPLTASGTEYVGRVVDINTQLPIGSAKVTLDLDGKTTIVYTDSEGIYQFNLISISNRSGQIRVDAPGYRVYTRNITIDLENTNIEDIRLDLLP